MMFFRKESLNLIQLAESFYKSCDMNATEYLLQTLQTNTLGLQQLHYDETIDINHRTKLSGYLTWSNTNKTVSLCLHIITDNIDTEVCHFDAYLDKNNCFVWEAKKSYQSFKHRQLSEKDIIKINEWSQKVLSDNLSKNTFI